MSNDLHVLTIVTAQGTVNVDRIDTPATSAAYAPPAQTGIIRIEETDPAIEYSSLPITSTARSWDYDPILEASARYVATNDEGGNDISFTYDGTWLNLGFIGSAWSG